jgi:PAS domain S-box-containing protein
MTENSTVEELEKRVRELERNEIRLKAAKEREDHIKQVLLAIRNVNQLIVQETDPANLIAEACRNLTETMGYHNAWIAMLDKAGRHTVMTASSGFADEFPAMRQKLEAGEFPDCMQQALAADETIVIRNPPFECRNCPLSREYQGRSGLSRRLASGGRIYGILSVSVPAAYAYDIEEQDLFREVAGDLGYALRKSEESESLRRANEIIERSPAVAFVWENAAGWPVEYVSANVERLFGWSAEEFTSGALPFASLIHPDDLARVQSEVEKGGSDPAVFEIDHEPYRILDRRGTARWVKDLTTVRRSTEGQVLAYQGILIDMTRQKEVEAELVRRNRFIETILDNLPIGLSVTFSDEGRTSYMNRSFQEIYGWPEEVLQDTESFFGSVFPEPCYREAVKRWFYGEMRREDPDRTLWEGIEAAGPDGRKKTVTVKNIPLPEQNCIISTVQDVTESRKLQAQLQHAQKMEAIGTLASGIAHDFNNILASVIGYTDLVLDQLEEGSDLHASLSEVMVAGLRARDLVYQILTLSRREEHEKKPIPIVPLAKEALKMLRSTIPASIVFRDHICTEELIAHADPTQIHQVIMNLATNAVHAMTDMEGVLEVGVERIQLDEPIDQPYTGLGPGAYARITVSDNGIGISAEHREKIFEPYFTTKEKGHGTGLGLSVVHGIVKSHGGHITVCSEPGKGSTFNVYLPLAESRADEMTRTAAETLPAGTERILLVDDELAIVNLHRHNLERLGYRVTVAENGLAALELFEAAPGDFDLVITDMTMPQMTGEKLAQAVKQIRPHVPVILCTGFSERINGREKSLASDAVLMKPIDKKRMAETIRSLIDRSRGPA